MIMCVTRSTILVSFLLEFYWIPQWVSNSEIWRGHNDVIAVGFVTEIFSQPFSKVKLNSNCWYSSAHSEQTGSLFMSEWILMFHYSSQLSIHSIVFSLLSLFTWASVILTFMLTCVLWNYFPSLEFHFPEYPEVTVFVVAFNDKCC